MANLKRLSAEVKNLSLKNSATGHEPKHKMHRINEVRKEQGISIRNASRRLGIDVPTLRAQESGETELSLSELYAWQELLQVPISHLLVEPEDALSQSVLERAQLVRLMKTANAMLETAKSQRMRCMVKTLIEQLIEIMPELKEVNSWHTSGQRRSLDDFGRIMDQPISEEWLTSGLKG